MKWIEDYIFLPLTHSACCVCVCPPYISWLTNKFEFFFSWSVILNMTEADETEIGQVGAHGIQ